jgi:3-deoxy-manno-octulosonate cytidylyltransferase (CMP-KDO synthetase)
MDSAKQGLAVIIPARFESVRFPGKLLHEIAGKTVLERTWRRAREIGGLQGIWIATDSDEIARAAASFGAGVLRTGRHPSGTDRVGEAVGAIQPAPGWVINLQGDEPLLDPRAIEQVAAALRAGDGEIVTCAAPLASPRDWLDPAVVKVVISRAGRALYFSRAPVPGSPSGPVPEAFELARQHAFQHIGIYGYPVALLQRFLALAPSPLEEAESLEQLRALEAGIPIRVIRLTVSSPAVDTPADLLRVCQLVEEEQIRKRVDGRGDTDSE